MAKANVTSTAPGAQGAIPAPATPELNPSNVNPLIVVGSPQDTITGVSEVLAFISGAMEHAEHSSGDAIPIAGGCTGLSRILDTCRAALKYHLDEEGGAA